MAATDGKTKANAQGGLIAGVNVFKDNIEILAVGLAVGLALGAAWGAKHFPKKVNSDCAFTTQQILEELNKLPPESSSATIQIPFIKQNGQWIGYRPKGD